LTRQLTRVRLDAETVAEQIIVFRWRGP